VGIGGLKRTTSQQSNKNYEISLKLLERPSVVSSDIKNFFTNSPTNVLKQCTFIKNINKYSENKSDYLQAMRVSYVAEFVSNSIMSQSNSGFVGIKENYQLRVFYLKISIKTFTNAIKI
jgi:hypothetical protein